MLRVEGALLKLLIRAYIVSKTEQSLETRKVKKENEKTEYWQIRKVSHQNWFKHIKHSKSMRIYPSNRFHLISFFYISFYHHFIWFLLLFLYISVSPSKQTRNHHQHSFTIGIMYALLHRIIRQYEYIENCDWLRLTCWTRKRYKNRHASYIKRAYVICILHRVSLDF